MKKISLLSILIAIFMGLSMTIDVMASDSNFSGIFPTIGTPEIEDSEGKYSYNPTEKPIIVHNENIYATNIIVSEHLEERLGNVVKAEVVLSWIFLAAITGILFIQFGQEQIVGDNNN